ncbi:hypothetical protein SI65_09441 [Aspergillus cristatus]|uniref:Ricin B lectin domain-containing protein n=1 Tax=Aspergillus cristatus TaxID=573508 RepID=A0A1E3B2M7_ASPCR|nr:hypothetical protein SI65_09441 [Aspergillus cristatus]
MDQHNQPGDTENIQGSDGESIFAIINCSTRKHLSIADGRVVTTTEPPVDNPRNQWALENPAGAGKDDDGLRTILNADTGEAIDQSKERSIQLTLDDANEPIPHWKLVPAENSDELFYIASAQSGHCLKDAGSGTENTAVSIAVFPGDLCAGDGSVLWKFASLAASGNLTPIENLGVKGAKEAMQFLIGEWKDNKVADGKSGRKMLSLSEKNNQDNLNEFRKNKDLFNYGIRIDLQNFIQGTPRFANIQGQMRKRAHIKDSVSVFQVNVQVEHNFGAPRIRREMMKSLGNTEEIWLRA